MPGTELFARTLSAIDVTTPPSGAAVSKAFEMPIDAHRARLTRIVCEQYRGDNAGYTFELFESEVAQSATPASDSYPGSDTYLREEGLRVMPARTVAANNATYRYDAAENDGAPFDAVPRGRDANSDVRPRKIWVRLTVNASTPGDRKLFEVTLAGEKCS